jgi:hypoxanthine phosphoribosyltransferase
MNPPKEIRQILFSADQIRQRVQVLGKQISDDYQQAEPLILIGILKGSFYFLADLSRTITHPVEIEFMSISSYGSDTVSSGNVKILKDLDRDISGRDVLLVEDILDTGLTLDYLLRSLEARNPKSLKVCTLLDKPERRQVSVPVAYRGFEIPDAFVVGYGLDYDQMYRNLPYIGVLEP